MNDATHTRDTAHCNELDLWRSPPQFALSSWQLLLWMHNKQLVATYIFQVSKLSLPFWGREGWREESSSLFQVLNFTSSAERCREKTHQHRRWCPPTPTYSQCLWSTHDVRSNPAPAWEIVRKQICSPKRPRAHWLSCHIVEHIQ